MAQFTEVSFQGLKPLACWRVVPYLSDFGEGEGLGVEEKTLSDQEVLGATSASFKLPKVQVNTQEMVTVPT